MIKDELRDLNSMNLISNVRFIESSCSPLVVEVTYGEKVVKRELLKSESNEVLSFKNIRQAYEVCRDAGIHQAELVQIIPHDEACAGSYISYDQQSVPLRF